MTASKLLAEARAQIAWRQWCQEKSPDHQEAMITQQARALAIYRSEIGRAALRIGAALETLIAEIGGFLEKWSDGKGAEIATRTAIEDAGLSTELDTLEPHFNPDHFAAVVAELWIWYPLLTDVMNTRLEECAPLDCRTGPAESEGKEAA